MGKQSSARLSGDDYQHLFSWVECLRILKDSYEYRVIQLESSEAGSVDDIVLFPSDVNTYPVKCYQLKFHVVHKAEFSIDFLTSKSSKSKQSMLEKLWISYQKLSKKFQPELYLVTNWLWGKKDTLRQFVKDNYGLSDEFFIDSKKSKDLKHALAEHLGVAETDLSFIKFLKSLRFMVSYDPIRLNDSLQLTAGRVGVVSDGTSRLKAIGIVRQWIKEKRDKVVKSDVEAAIQKGKLKAQDSKLIVYLHTKEVQSFAESPDQVLNFVDLFQGRNVKKDRYWNEIILNQIKTLKDLINTTSSIRKICLFGKSSLSVGTAFGFIFSDSAGYQIEIWKGNRYWNSLIKPKAIRLNISKINLNPDAQDIGIALSISGEIGKSVLQYVQSSGIFIKELYFVKALSQPSNTVLTSDSEAKFISNKIRELIRTYRVSHSRSISHIFTACPLALAVMLGHQLNACGSIQLYEYLDPGYTKSILL